MELQHINVKIFTKNTESVDLEVIMAIFNNWIQRQVADELLIDVADYRHVTAGPGVVLVGHEATFSLDSVENRLGLLYNRTAGIEGTNQARMHQAVHAVLSACRRLEAENGFSFNGDEIQIILNDRLQMPNTTETLQEIEPELYAFFGRLYAGAPFSIARNSRDPRERLSIRITSASSFDLETLLKNLERAQVGV